jgi:hypothetical protein
MIEAAREKRRTYVSGSAAGGGLTAASRNGQPLESPASGQLRAATHIGLFVATWAEALPLLGFAPRVTGMGRCDYDFSGCDAVLSAGFAGACRPELRAGDVLLAGYAPPDLRERLSARPGEIRTIDHIASPAEKAAFGRDGAAAVDMETAWLAAAAGVPFLSVRVIVDRLEDRPLSLATAWNYPLASRALRTAVAQAHKFLSHRNGRGEVSAPAAGDRP